MKATAWSTLLPGRQVWRGGGHGQDVLVETEAGAGRRQQGHVVTVYQVVEVTLGQGGHTHVITTGEGAGGRRRHPGHGRPQHH